MLEISISEKEEVRKRLIIILERIINELKEERFKGVLHISDLTSLPFISLFSGFGVNLVEEQIHLEKMFKSYEDRRCNK